MRALRVLAWLVVAVALPVAAVQAVPPAAGTERLSAALAQLGEYGETIYDAVKADNWSTAQRQGGARPPKGGGPHPTVALDRRDSAVEAALAAAIKDRRRDAALREANRLTLVTAEMASRFDPPIPLAVNRLDYLGRELEIWAERMTNRASPRPWRTSAPRGSGCARSRGEARRPAHRPRRRPGQSPGAGAEQLTVPDARHELLDAVDRLETTLKKERR